jgi:hypothetical protein
MPRAFLAALHRCTNASVIQHQPTCAVRVFCLQAGQQVQKLRQQTRLRRPLLQHQWQAALARSSSSSSLAKLQD